MKKFLFKKVLYTLTDFLFVKYSISLTSEEKMLIK